MTDHDKFRRDMKKANISVEEYKGKFFWKGPAVFTDRKNGPSYDDVVRATKVKLQYDDFGLDKVVYPAASD